MEESDLAQLRRRRGQWLRRAREIAGLKQNDVAQRLGLKAGTTILAWEKGRRSPDADQMLALAAIYGVPVEMFADPKPTEAEMVIEARAALARAAIELAHEDLDRAAASVRGADARQASQPDRRSA